MVTQEHSMSTRELVYKVIDGRRAPHSLGHTNKKQMMVVAGSDGVIQVIDGTLVGCAEPPPFNLVRLEEYRVRERGELVKSLIIQPKRICDEERCEVTAEDRKEWRSLLTAIGWILQLDGGLALPLVLTLPGRCEAVVKGKHASGKTLKPIALSAADKLKLQNEVVREGGSVRWSRPPVY
jgi:hypothetical protein